MRTYIGLFILSAVVTLLVVPLVRALGHRLRAYGHAHDGRNASDVPRLGGLAIIFACLAAWAVLLLIPNLVSSRLRVDWHLWTPLFIPSAMILMLGIYDDLKGSNAVQKFSVQIAAAGLLWWIAPAYRITGLPFAGHGLGQGRLSPLVSLAFTVLWIVAVTNSLNLIDGVDGLAAGIAFFAALSTFVVSLINGHAFLCIMSITAAGALAGFLRFNFAPATIYLGDTGSLFLGFVLAAMAIGTSQKNTMLVAIVAPYAAFSLPLVDTALTVVRRFLSGKRIFSADTNHIHHRLLQKGLSPRMVALSLYALAGLFSLASLLVIQSTGNLAVLFFVLGGSCVWFLARLIRYEEFSELSLSMARSLKREDLAGRILVRKAALQVKQAADLEESWRYFAEAVRSLGFEALCFECRDPDLLLPPLLGWESPLKKGGQSLSAVVPLRVSHSLAGELHFRWAAGNNSKVLDLLSVLEILIPSMENQLERYSSPQCQRQIATPTPKVTGAPA